MDPGKAIFGHFILFGEAVGTTWEHAQLEFQKFLKIRIPLLVGEDPLGLGCDVDSVAGYIQSYCNVLENVDYCVDIVDDVDYCVDTVDIAAVRVAGKEGGEQRASGFSIGLSTVLRYYLVPRRVT